MTSQRSTINLLQLDPDLGEELTPQERTAAERVLSVPAVELEPGPWHPEEAFEDVRPVVGVMVVEGMLTRDVVFAGRTTTELLGAGDLLRPWDDDVQFDPLPFAVSWQVHLPSRMAILDTRVAMAAGRWPAIHTALGSRYIRRSRGLAFQRAIAQLPRVDDRLIVVLWALAERWGRVGPDGVKLPLDLPHRTLATLVGARRPSVTTALTGLSRAGLVERVPDGWLLHGDPADVLRGRLQSDRALSNG